MTAGEINKLTTLYRRHKCRRCISASDERKMGERPMLSRSCNRGICFHGKRWNRCFLWKRCLYQCFLYVTERNLGKTETNDDPRARKPAYDKIHCLTYERWGDGCQVCSVVGICLWCFMLCGGKPHVLSSVDGHAVFLWKCLILRRFHIEIGSWEVFSVALVEKVLFISF